MTTGFEPAAPAAPPIFVLSHARTGSTLMRYVLDSHPDVCSPPEIALGRLCHALTYTLALTAGTQVPGDEDARRVVVRRAVRRHVDDIMGDYLAAKQKKRWCDKSTNNVEHLDVISRIFPDAQFVCLHRNCMDVVHSLLELFRYGYPGRYGYHVARSPENIVGAMVDTWLEATENLLRFEGAHRARCLRITYESLVADPAAALQRMFGFLDLPFAPELLERVFSVKHDAGPGDIKIQFTSSILPGRIGKGKQVPKQNLSGERLAKVNALHQELGYPIVDLESGPALQHVLNAPSNTSRPVEAERWG